MMLRFVCDDLGGVFFLSFLGVLQWSLAFPIAFLISRLLSCSQVEKMSPTEPA